MNIDWELHYVPRAMKSQPQSNKSFPWDPHTFTDTLLKSVMTTTMFYVTLLHAVNEAEYITLSFCDQKRGQLNE